MAITSSSLDRTGLRASRARFAMLLPPFLGLVYPFILLGFNDSITGILAATGTPDIPSWIGAVLTLTAAFGVSIVALLIVMKLTAIERPTIAESRAKKIAFLAVAAPTSFVFLGVVMTMLSLPTGDIWVWSAAWAIALLWVASGDGRGPADLRLTERPVWLRYAHGFSALGILLVFLILHLTNHLFFMADQDTYMVVMKLFRQIYRSNLIQPLVVALALFQVASGLFIASRTTTTGIDRFRAFQIASGLYLAIYIIGHLDSVFIYARRFSGIETDWAFATGAPAGMLKDAWNIRLLPHYGLAVFFVISHVFAGARVVMLQNGVSKGFADGFMVSGATFAAAVATFIMLGMVGTRITFALPG